MKLLDVLFDYIDSQVTGDKTSRLYRTHDEWDYVREDEDGVFLGEESAGIFARIFPVENLVSQLTRPKNFYSFRCRYGYPKLSEMSEDQVLELFGNYIRHMKWDCSPFGSGSDECWDWTTTVIDGKRYMLTYGYMGS